MLTGYVDGVSRQHVAGWAFNSDNPDERVEVAVLIGGEGHGRIRADVFRKDLHELGTFGDGKHGFIYRFDVPLSLIESYEIVVRFADGDALRPGRLTIPKATIEPRDGLSPILVTSTGRSGTSLMMRRLVQDQSIVVAGHFPYETKILSYYAHAFTMLTAAGDHERSMNPSTIFSDPYHLGLNPFNHHYFADTFTKPRMIHEFFEKDAAPIVADAFKQIVSRFYDQVRLTQTKCGASYFAEKCEVFNPTRDFTRAIYGNVREIILLRDPRDVFCSYRSFWSTPVEQSMQILRSVRDKMLDFRREANSNSLFVRYEELVEQPEEVLARISEFLGLDHAIAIDRERESADFKVHATSMDKSASIGRWQNELDWALLQEFNRDFGEFFETFGYARAKTPSGRPAAAVT